MDDKKAAAIKYQQWLKEQKQLERKLKAESDELCIREGRDKIPNHEYMNEPAPPPLIITPIIIEGEKPSSFKTTKYKGVSDYNRKYWNDNKERIREKRKAERISTRVRRTFKTDEERKEEARKRDREYYQNNRERLYEAQRKYKEANKEKAKEYAAKYRAKLEAERQALIQQHDPSEPSPFLVAITKNGCNVCGRTLQLYNFQNPETKYYTGCLCVSCLHSYNNLDRDESKMFKLREYALKRARANKENEKE